MPDAGLGKAQERKAGSAGLSPEAPEKTRTSTDHTVHKTVNLNRPSGSRSSYQNAEFSCAAPAGPARTALL